MSNGERGADLRTFSSNLRGCIEETWTGGMVPDVRTAAAVAHETMLERERVLARRQVMSELPVVPGRGLLVRRRVACCMGRRLVGTGLWLLRYGRQEIVGMPWAVHPN